MSFDEDVRPDMDDDEAGPPDPDEELAHALWWSRSTGASHRFDDWRGIWHSLRAGDVKVRAAAERAVVAERIAVLVGQAVAAVRDGHPVKACELLDAAKAKVAP